LLAVRTAPLLLVVLLLSAVAAGGCAAAGGTDRPNTRETLLLDFQPNAVHSGIYLARQRGYDKAEGVDLQIEQPTASTDSLKLLRSGRADAAILDIHDLALARERGADVVGVMALVQRPLAAVLAQPGIRSPRQLEGRRAGVTGLPSDEAVLSSIVRGAGGDPARVRTVTIGFQAVKALLARRVDAATAFWNVEGVALKRRRPGIREFRVDDYGAPSYPELVLCVNRTTLEDRLPEVRGIVRALQRGYVETEADPESAIEAMMSQVDGLDRSALEAQMSAVQPDFAAGVRTYGTLDRDRLHAWARWEARFGIVRRPPDVERAFDFSLVGPVSRG
jgi:ABC-type nitrate/sulfonate/bicarbonate transport system substrate-binding protein